MWGQETGGKGRGVGGYRRGVHRRGGGGEGDGREARGVGVPERCANAVLAQVGRVQSVFFPWEYGGEIAIWCRISAQVYNVVEDYEKLARAVAAVKLIEGTD